MPGMTFDELMATTQRLNVSVEALAAVAACLRLRADGMAAPPAVDRLAHEAATLVGIDDLEQMTPEQCQMAVGAVRAFFRQAAELIDAPDRPCGWITDDPSVLQSQGRASMMVAGLLASLAPGVGDLDRRLRSGSPALLDLGTGTGWLAIALAETFPTATVVGVDVADAPLALAHTNLASSGVADRVSFRHGDAAHLVDEATFDLVWVPGPFLTEAAVPAVLQATHRALRPGGWVMFGRYAGPDDPLAATLVDLRTVRSGGHPWRAGDVEALLAAHGFTEVITPQRTWAAPMAFSFGRRA